jgi:hypothetical protein
MSTTYHQQTSGQTERIDHVFETYLECYSNYEQNDSASMLAIAQYVYNNTKHVATKTSAFYANCGFAPQTNCPTKIQFRTLAFELYGQCMNSVYSNLRECLEESFERM